MKQVSINLRVWNPRAGDELSGFYITEIGDSGVVRDDNGERWRVDGELSRLAAVGEYITLKCTGPGRNEGIAVFVEDADGEDPDGDADVDEGVALLEKNIAEMSDAFQSLDADDVARFAALAVQMLSQASEAIGALRDQRDEARAKNGALKN